MKKLNLITYSFSIPSRTAFNVTRIDLLEIDRFERHATIKVNTEKFYTI